MARIIINTSASLEVEQRLIVHFRSHSASRANSFRNFDIWTRLNELSTLEFTKLRHML
ncbi:hypothetical protein BDW22DRAFT_1364005 [Trametopsis cervina]|nr:hypothetical protein BDW22DRAFT_1364005 [Trametopsis cervina]